MQWDFRALRNLPDTYRTYIYVRRIALNRKSAFEFVSLRTEAAVDTIFDILNASTDSGVITNFDLLFTRSLKGADTDAKFSINGDIDRQFLGNFALLSPFSALTFSKWLRLFWICTQ